MEYIVYMINFSPKLTDTVTCGGECLFRCFFVLETELEDR